MKDTHRQRDLLFEAVRLGRVDLIRRLLAGGANINAIEPNGGTPLYVAVTLGNKQVAKLLLEEAADTESTVANPISEGAQHDIKSEAPIHAAAKKGQIGMVRMLLEAKASPNPSTTAGCVTPLHSAISQGHTRTAQILIEGGADIMARNSEDWTPLHCAVYRSNVDITRLLISRGVEIEAVTSSQNSHKLTRKRWLHTTPLFLAAWNGDGVITEMLLAAGANPRARIIDNCTTLHAAVYGGRVMIATMLLDADDTLHKGAAEAFIDMKRIDGDTALHVAASKAKLDFVQILVARQANVKSLNALQRDPYEIALNAKSSNEKKKVVKLLRRTLQGVPKTSED